MTLSSRDNTVRVSIWIKPDGIPMFGNWDSDKKTDIAIYRPADSIWNVRYSDSPTVITEFKFGTTGDIPVAGDFDGDRKQDYVVFRPSTGEWWIKKSTNQDVIVNHFGLPGDIPTPADFDGDGRCDLAVFRPSTGVWYIMRSAVSGIVDPTSTNPYPGFRAVQFGTTGDIPVAADMDGDGRVDIAIYRPSSGTWYILRWDGSFYAIPFGLATDKPIPSAYINTP